MGSMCRSTLALLALGLGVAGGCAERSDDPATSLVSVSAALADGEGCGDVAVQGCCDGLDLYYCSSGSLAHVECTGSCGWDGDHGWYDCGFKGEDPDGELPKACPAAGGCGAIGYEGCCDGVVLSYCAGDTVSSAPCDGGCGWDAENGYYNCGGNGADPSGAHPLACPGGCTPDCAGKSCGSDGCGGSCGSCGAGTSCAGGQCVGTCTPDCTNKQCGSDGCGGSCGACPGGLSCKAGACVDECAPSCDGRECGDDGCGGSCGACPPSQACGDAGHCEQPRTGCGAVSVKGTCDGDVLMWCEGDQVFSYDCGQQQKSCGLDPKAGTYDCLSGSVPVCTPACGGRECGDDGCGGVCGSCAADETCTKGGSCAGLTACTPDCGGHECGDDGCGGSCGKCPIGFACGEDGACLDLAGCEPDCKGKQCGADGCGGSCGTCSGGLECTSNQCVSTEPLGDGSPATPGGGASSGGGGGTGGTVTPVTEAPSGGCSSAGETARLPWWLLLLAALGAARPRRVTASR